MHSVKAKKNNSAKKI